MRKRHETGSPVVPHARAYPGGRPGLRTPGTRRATCWWRPSRTTNSRRRNVRVCSRSWKHTRTLPSGRLPRRKTWPGFDFGRYAFMRASTWPDDIRKTGSPYDHPPWAPRRFSADARRTSRWRGTARDGKSLHGHGAGRNHCDGPRLVSLRARGLPELDRASRSAT